MIEQLRLYLAEWLFFKSRLLAPEGTPERAEMELRIAQYCERTRRRLEYEIEGARK